MSDEEMALNALPEATTPSDAGPSTAPSTGEAPMSKKAMKRAAKRAKYEEHKLEKRAAERARRRERAHYLAEGYAAGTLSAEDAALFEKQREMKRARKASSRGVDAGAVHPAAVVIDLGFDDLMTDQEITSMHSQLGYVYSINRTAKRPFAAVVHTSFSPELSPRLWNKMGKAQWQRWARMWFMKEDVGEIAKVLGKTEEEVEAEDEAESGAKPMEDKPDVETKEAGEPSEPVPESSTAPAAAPSSTEDPYANLVRHLTPALPSTIPRTHKLVYLSADADEELTTLADDEVYVIGGIVDRNRHKMLCQNKAERLGIRTARLPIGTYLANLPTRKVLTVNQVFDILSQYLALGDWAAAFEAVIPQRKFFTGKEEKKAANKKKGGDGGEGEGADGEESGGEGEGEERDAVEEVVSSEAGEGEDVAMKEEAAVNA